MHDIDRILSGQVEKDKTPAVQYIFFDQDRIIHKFHGGFADIKKQERIAENTTFQVFSVTKTFTALAVLQLAERKKLELNQPAMEILPGFPYSPAITIRQLMAHSAGIPNPVPLDWIHLVGEHPAFDRNDFFRQVFTKHQKAKSSPNERFAYSNLGYVLLGELIEKISGLSYEEYIRGNIIRPLNLESNELDFIINDPDAHARGYHKKISFSNGLLGFFLDKKKYMDKTEGKWQPFQANYVNGTAYGGLIGTSRAFVKYMRELLKPGCILISDDYKRMLFTENRTNDSKPTGMCLSWFKGRLNGEPYFAHAGGGGGYYCEIRIYPGRRMGSVIMFNRTGMKDERFLNRLDKFIVSLQPESEHEEKQGR